MRLLLLISISNLFCFFGNRCFPQCQESKIVWDSINKIDTNARLSDKQKLAELFTIKENAENCKSINDTSYTLILIKLGKYEYRLNKDYDKAIDYTISALKVNEAIKLSGSKRLNIYAFYSLGFFYDEQLLYKKALTYYDSVIITCNYFKTYDIYEMWSLDAKANIYFITGDYEKAVEVSSIGMDLASKQKNPTDYVYFLNRKAQALFFENHLPQALEEAQKAILMATNLDTFELATAYKTLGLIYEKKKQLDSALHFYNLALETRLLTKEAFIIASDYNDLGNFYLNSLNHYKIAATYYNKTLQYATKMQDPLSRSLKQSLAYTNLGENSLRQFRLKEAANFFILAFSFLNINLQNNILNNPTSVQLSNIINKDLVIVLMDNKTQLLLEQYKKTKQETFLKACISCAKLTDSVITQIRHEQLGKQSKLYWRNKTREFFTSAMDACFLGDDSNQAFYFMEKSRAVLLNDELNELDASASLSQSEIEEQEKYKAKVLLLEQKLASLENNSKQFHDVEVQLAIAKTDLDQFIKSFEKKYPAYYQYKYEETVPTLKDLQHYLAKNNQSFVHYFLGDTLTYILVITPTNTKFIRLSQKEFNKEDLSEFLQFCANKEKLNNHYDSFAILSNSIYKKIFQPLQLLKGRIIICSDNIVIPFDALCTDITGRNFLLNDYTFSYVYSARFLMKQFSSAIPKGNFVGFAPVSFKKYLNVVDLKNAADALQASASYYKNDKLFTHENASQSNFFNYAASYSIINIFSHAWADTTDNEPRLYMQDSVIHLSELQLLNNPATQLVLLSACQTNVGKAATGEGIYSLARGFAAAGIPSVAATLWNADEQTIYTVSEKFNEYLSEGMNKDEALQKAKLDFVKNNAASDKMLPYYWANMIVIGNTDAIKFDASSGYSLYIWLTIAAVVLIIATVIIIKKKYF